MQFQHAALIYNPESGRLKALREKKVEGARETLAEWIPRVDKMATAAPGDARRLAREAVEAGCDLIAACGGDGTFNEVIGGMAGSGATLLPLPAGTANVLAEQAKIPRQPDKAAKRLPQLKLYEVPLGIVRPKDPETPDRLFLLLCGVGVDASIVYNLDARLKAYLGEGAYWLGSLEHLNRKLHPFHIRVNDETHECTFALISKSRMYAGRLVVTPNAHLFSNDFEVVIFHGRSPLRYVGYLAQIATDTLDRMEDVTFCRSDRVELLPCDADPVYIEVDGESVGRIPAIVEMADQHLNMLLPPRFADRLTKGGRKLSLAALKPALKPLP